MNVMRMSSAGLAIAFLIMSVSISATEEYGKIAPKPLFRDPIHDGAADPVLCWNGKEEKWFMFYTNRRADVTGEPGVSWVHGTRIGVAESADEGATWKYRGTAKIDCGEKDYSYWAPEVIEHDGAYHMYLTVVPGTFSDWSHPRSIVHLTSDDLLEWNYQSTLKLSSDRVIDACVFRMPNGAWRMWYNNEPDGKSTYYADSPDLYTWTDHGKALKDRSGEGPKVFRWKESYWMVVDIWDGLGLYKSSDCQEWERQKTNLLQTPGKGVDDKVKGGHPDVVVSGDRAFLFYFTHPGRQGPDAKKDTYEQRRSSIQVVELEYKDGIVTCDRDQPTRIRLLPPASRDAEENFNAGWRFSKGEQTEQVQDIEFDDSKWQPVRLPHDWAISGPFNPEENGYAGKLPWRGVGWYRKTFTLKKADRGKQVYFDFDGVMAFPKVYVNGQLAGEWDYGYMSFRVDATPYVKFGEANVIAVQADTRRHGTRWYPGAGIYRKVALTIREPVHIAHWGTFVTTPKVTDSSATVRAQSTIENHQDTESKVVIDMTVLDPDGRAVGTGKKEYVLPAADSREIEQSFTIASPQRWDITNPKLYVLKTTVRINGKVLDAGAASFGIRTFRFTANDGFHLNDRRIQLHGVNLHHDHGPLGAAFYPRAMERQLEIMRDMGCNAIRTSHNPPAPELLELCDRMGLVVWDECFDKWEGTADRVDGEPPLEEHGQRQLRNLVMRDRNHPSVVVWSIGNEIADVESNKNGKAPEQVAFMREVVRKYDPTRPVGLGCFIPSAVGTGALGSLDLTGWNYDRRYAPYRKLFPDKPIVYSESASTLSSRGFYEFPLPNVKDQFSKQFQVDSYDLNAAPWSDIPDAEFKLMEDDRFVAGEFVWTGFDYLGEPTPFEQEAKSSYFGIVDLCGIPKDRFYLYRAHWRPDVTTAHILPHWNWPDRLGLNVPVFVYTNGDSAELFLNGKSLGRQVKGAQPKRPVDLARGCSAAASSFESDKGQGAANANDADVSTRWCAAAGGADQWWRVDLGKTLSIGYLGIEFEKEAKNYGYEIQVSSDASTWKTIAVKPTSSRPRWGGSRESFHEVDARARYVRIEFTDLQGGAWASIREFSAYSEKAESAYYEPTYQYRLRWNDVVYEPGELRAIAYKEGKKIGEAVMRTAGKPAAIRLTPDRTELSATGEDLSYILVEALDEKDTLCSLADNLIQFAVQGPAEIAGVGNGNPLSLEPFQADYRKLFHGKAMLILRSIEGENGEIKVTARSEKLGAGHANLRAHP